jgi:uncharacterized protein (TIGR03437 family)
MNQTLRPRTIALTVLALTFPIAALADLNQTTTLQSNSRLNLDTGATPGSGGDLLWNGITITPQGNAKAYNIGPFGSLDGLTKAYFEPFKIVASAATIPGSALVVGDVFAAFTNGGNTAGVLVTAKSGGSITLQFVTFIAVVPVGPTITQILNNSSGIPPGMPNYGIAPSSLFIVKGSGLADPGTPALQDTVAGLPLTLNGASIAVVVNNVTTHPALYYTSPNQLAAVLPAATPLGNGTLTVTYRGTVSAPAPILVVASAVGITHFSQLGTPNSNVDEGEATDAFSGALLTFTNSGAPGQTIVVWGTGLGADPADSDTTYIASPHAINTPMQVYFGGVLLTLLYQGATVYPGVDVIIFTIPASVPSGCYVPLVAVTGNIISNVATFPIHPGGGACIEPTTGISGDQILRNTQNTLKAASIGLVQSDSTNAKGVHTVSTSANAAFQKYDGLLAAATGQLVSPGGCVVGPLIAGGTLSLTGLDAGNITLSGPSGLSVTLAALSGFKGVYSANLADGAIPSSGGAFTFQGSGGVDVGQFTSTVTLSNPILAWTNQNLAAAVDRTQGLLVTWTGGNPGTYAVISGTSTTTSLVNAGYTCRIAVEARQFTVPSYILLGLPVGSGGTLIQNDIFVSLAAQGLDMGVTGGTISSHIASTVK